MQSPAPRAAALPARLTVRPGLRSLLFVPGDDERKLSRAADSEADGLILDLEDAVAPPAKAAAREQVLAFLAAAGSVPQPRPVLVRVNGVGTPWFRDDLDALRAAGVGVIMLPKSALRTVTGAAPRPPAQIRDNR